MLSTNAYLGLIKQVCFCKSCQADPVRAKHPLGNDCVLEQREYALIIVVRSRRRREILILCYLLPTLDCLPLLREPATNFSLLLLFHQVTIERKVMPKVGVSKTQQVDPTATQRCTGVLLDQNHVLTSASCVLPSDRLVSQLVDQLSG